MEVGGGVRVARPLAAAHDDRAGLHAHRVGLCVDVRRDIRAAVEPMRIRRNCVRTLRAAAKSIHECHFIRVLKIWHKRSIERTVFVDNVVSIVIAQPIRKEKPAKQMGSGLHPNPRESLLGKRTSLLVIGKEGLIRSFGKYDRRQLAVSGPFSLFQ